MWLIVSNSMYSLDSLCDRSLTILLPMYMRQFAIIGERGESRLLYPSLHKKATILQVTTMLATFKNILFTGHNHLLTTGTYELSLAGTRVMIKASGHQYRWLTGGYDLDIGHF